MILWRNIDFFSTFYDFDPDPRFPPFLLYIRWKSGVTFVRRCFRDDFFITFALCLGLHSLPIAMLISLISKAYPCKTKVSTIFVSQVINMSSSSNLVYLDWMIGGRVALDELWQFKRYYYYIKRSSFVSC